MKIFLLLFLSLVSASQAGSLSSIIEDEKFIIKSHTIYGTASNDSNTESGRYDRISLNYKDKYKIMEKLYFDVDIEAFHNTKEMDKHKNISLKYQKQDDIQINSLMISYIEEDYCLYGGAISFRGSKFSELKNPLRNGGNGIELLSDQVFYGVFSSTNIYDTSLIVGYAQWRKETNYNSLGYHNNDKSDGIFTVVKKDIDNHYIELNYFKVNVILDSSTEPINYADLDLLGVGYIYDDTHNTGLTFTWEGGVSHIKENNVELAKTTGVPLNILDYLGYITENIETTGYAWKTNLRYENEVVNTEYYIGIEYFKTYENWISMNHGTLFLSNNSYWQVKDGQQYTIYGGVNITKNLLLQLRYVYTKSDKVPAYFSVSTSVPPSQSPNPEDFFLQTSRFEIEVSYSF